MPAGSWSAAKRTNGRDDPADAWVRQADGTLQKLPELQPGPASAQGINRSGAIVGYSTASDGWPKAVLWRPQ